MWNPFKKNKNLDNLDQMGILQRLALKKAMSLSPGERERIFREFMSPENIEKNKDKILQVLCQMKASGFASESQIEQIKKKMGL